MPSHRINKLLTIILAAFLAICLRVLHLGTSQRDAKLFEAQKPQTRTLIQKADRGPIYDRFGIPLAVNKICYNATFYYSQITQIPSIKWEESQEKKKIRTFPRKEYIRSLSQILAITLNENAERIEDLIHSKASLFPHAPYILKSQLTEEEHYRLKSLEKDWPGVHAEITSERFYPLGKTACHLLGTMGAISKKKYTAIAEEMAMLKNVVETYEQELTLTLPPGYESFEKVCDRLYELKEKAYTLSDSVGKSGIEGQFEEDLRGFFGKHTFEIDQKGRVVRRLPGDRASLPGRKITLSISAELQQFAEELLAENEKQRDGRSFGIDPSDKKRKNQKQPWIKGGAIVALNPNNGEILAMASFPRFDPNDFVTKSNAQTRLCRWLENASYIGAIWDGREPLTREIFNGRRFIEETCFLHWELFLDSILAKDSPLRLFFQTFDNVKTAIQIQEDFDIVRYFSKQPTPLDTMIEVCAAASKGTWVPESEQAAKRLIELLSSIPSCSDKLFAIDLCRTLIDSPRFTDELISKIGSMKLSVYRELCSAFLKIDKEAKENARLQFRKTEFQLWRKEHQKEFLAEKRSLEKKQKLYPKPYLDYLDQKERLLFSEYWINERLSIVQEQMELNPIWASTTKDLSTDLKLELLHTFRSFSELDRPLFSNHHKLRTEQDLAGSFYPKGGFGYLRSYAFQSGAPLGSLFKLVTSYESLRQGHCPLLIDDWTLDPKKVAYSLNKAPYPRIYKGGRLPRSSVGEIGQIDIAGALEQSSNPYFSILAGDYLAGPEDLVAAARSLGFGEKSGLQLPGEIAGHLPNDLKGNRTNLYSFAIGQHTLLTNPLQTSVMLSALVNEGKVFKPKIVRSITGLAPDRQILSAFDTGCEFAGQELRMLGIPFALFTKMQVKPPLEQIGALSSEIRKTVPIPSALRSQIFEGMNRVMWSAKGSARSSSIRSLRGNSALLADYLSMQHQVIGKTSTAEILYQPNVNPSSLAQIIKYTWFGAISFFPDYPIKARYDHPELTVVVFLRFGDAGKEAAPIAVQLLKKWREIQKKHETETPDS